MKRNDSLFYIFVLSLVFLYGCSMSLGAGVDTTSEPLKPTLIISKKKEGVHIECGEVSTVENGKIVEVWLFSSDISASPPLISRVKYGVLPPGFREDVKPQQLQVGKVYKFAVILGDYSSLVYFQIINVNGKNIIQVVDADKFH